MGKTCEITNVTNRTSGKIMVTKLEDIGANSFLVEAGQSTVNLIWLPVVASESAFVKKTLVVLSLTDSRILGFLWQTSDAVIRVSKTGYSDDAKPLAGRNTDRVSLTVRADGSLHGD